MSKKKTPQILWLGPRPHPPLRKISITKQHFVCNNLPYPGDYDEHTGGHVDGQQVVGELTLEHHQDLRVEQVK